MGRCPISWTAAHEIECYHIYMFSLFSDTHTGSCMLPNLAVSVFSVQEPTAIIGHQSCASFRPPTVSVDSLLFPSNLRVVKIWHTTIIGCQSCASFRPCNLYHLFHSVVFSLRQAHTFSGFWHIFVKIWLPINTFSGFWHIYSIVWYLVWGMHTHLADSDTFLSRYDCL